MKIIIEKKDLKRQTFHCGGHGGQNVNKVETGVRFTHLPTGIVAEGREERTQGRNQRLAINNLVKKIRLHYEAEVRRKAAAEYDAKPEAAFGNKLRTYYLCGQKRVVDHKTGKEYDVAKVLNGELPR